MAASPQQTTYRALVQHMWADGRIVAEEVTTLTTMQVQLGLSLEDAQAIEREIIGMTKEEALVAGLGTNTPPPMTRPRSDHGDLSGGSTLVPGGTPIRKPASVTFSGGQTASPGTPAWNLDARAAGSAWTQIQPEDVLAERFEVLSMLGGGGMGQVFKVMDLELRETRALKVIRPELLAREDLKERFINEVRLCQKLTHPGIMRVYDYGRDSARGLTFFTMEYIDGLTLRAWLSQKIRKGELVTLGEFKAIAQGICEPLIEAHKVTIHRDLKPENVMIERTTKRFKLMDFGIAKSLGPAGASSSSVSLLGVGTPYYVAPEQEQGEKIDARADIYSLGVMFYEVLAGEVPRAGSSPLGEERKDLPPEISMAIGRAMQRRVENRPETVQTFWSALSESLARPGSRVGTTTPVPATKPSVSDSLPKEVALDLGGGVKMELVLIPSGEFMMGGDQSPEEVARLGGGEADWYKREHPRHRVKISQPFYMGKYQVTVGQFRRFVEATKYKTDAERGGQDFEGGKKGGYVWTGTEWKWREDASWRNPGFSQSDDHPVVLVSWNDAQAFCKWVGSQDGRAVRLPTESEWEYACRAGTTTPFHFGETISTDQANYHGNYTYGSGRKGQYREKTTPVGSFPPNAWGLHDMHGNVWEWCEDVWHDNYENAPTDGSAWNSGGDSSSRVLRGGSWSFDPRLCRSAGRDGVVPAYRDDNLGLRVLGVSGGFAGTR